MTRKVHKNSTKRKRLIDYINDNKQRGDIILISEITGYNRYIIDKTLQNKVKSGKKSDAIIMAFVNLIKNRENIFDKSLKSISHEN